MKLNAATHAAWSSPTAAQTQPQSLSSNPFNNPPTAATQNGTHPPNATQNPQQLSAPPGVAPQSGSNSYGQQAQAQGHSHPPGTMAIQYTSNGDATAGNVGAPSPTNQPLPAHPQTPAQQILMSAADRWGLLGLLAMIKGAGRDMDGPLSNVGTDLGTMGLDMEFQG